VILGKSSHHVLILLAFGLMGSLLLFTLLSIISLATLSFTTGLSATQLLESQQGLGGSPFGFLLLVTIPQVSLLAFPFAYVAFSGQTLHKALKLRTNAKTVRYALLALLATPAIGIWASLGLTACGLRSDSIEGIELAIRSHAVGWYCLPIVFAVALLPGFCEEILFRGFCQGLLRTAVPIWCAITISAIIFAVFHGDLIHALGVFPLGLWLGFLVHRSDSLIPAIIGHASNNALGAVATILTTAPSARELSNALEPTYLTIPLLALGSICAIVVIASKPTADE
jgi:membrane protease YdiL (CAAX protease family)